MKRAAFHQSERLWFDSTLADNSAGSSVVEHSHFYDVFGHHQLEEVGFKSRLAIGLKSALLGPTFTESS